MAEFVALRTGRNQVFLGAVSMIRRLIRRLTARDRAVDALFEKNARPRIAGLPAYVMDVLDASTVMRRHDNDDGPRVFILLPGVGSYAFSHDETLKRIANAWPELEEHQVARAAQWMVARVHRQFRTEEKASRKSWLQDY